MELVSKINVLIGLLGANDYLEDIKNEINKIQVKKHYEEGKQIFIDFSQARDTEQMFNKSFIEQLEIAGQILVNNGFKILVYAENEENKGIAKSFAKIFKDDAVKYIGDLDKNSVFNYLAQSELVIFTNEKALFYALLFEKPFVYISKETKLLESIELQDLGVDFKDKFNAGVLLDKVRQVQEKRELIKEKIRTIFGGSWIEAKGKCGDDTGKIGIEKNDIQTNADAKQEFELYQEKFKKNIEVLIEQGLLREAEELLAEYEKIVPNDIDIYSIKGVIAMMEGDFEEAERVMKKGLLIDGENFDLLYNLGYLYQMKEDYELSLSFYVKAKAMNDNNKELNDEIDTFINEIKKELNKKQTEIQRLREIEFKKRLDRIKFAKKQKLIKKDFLEENIHIVYVLTHVGICGGVKIIFDHANNLVRMGMKVTLISHFPKPTWYPINCDYIQVSFEKELAEGIPNCDVVVATYWDHIQACVDVNKAPVVYFEQGDFHIFDYNSLHPTIKDFIYKQFQLPKFIFTVSNQCAKLIKEIYNRDALVIPNAIDGTIFNDKIDRFNKIEEPYILMVGNPNLAFKGIGEIIDAFSIVKTQIPNIKLYLISPIEPKSEIKDKIDKIFVNPPQQQIADLYRKALLYVCASHYESFCLPVLEAMACGCPVVSTGNVGVLEYAKNNYNALIAKIGDPLDIATKMLKILKNDDLRNKLIKNGLLTAKKFEWSNTTSQLIELYREVASYKAI